MFLRKVAAGVEWIFVFLGNPGAKYAGTRHNAGFQAAAVFEQETGTALNRLRWNALTAVCDFGGVRVLGMKPQTYMNLSGSAVAPAMGFYKVPLDHVLVFSDDVSLAPGRLRVRRQGSAGGHNGLKDIIAKCGGDGFPRVKIGVGAPPHPDYDMADWVLGVPRNQDGEAVAQGAARAVEAARVLVSQGVDAAMARFNAAPPPAD